MLLKFGWLCIFITSIKVHDYITLITLKGLSLFYKILPISNTGDSIAHILATVHFLYPKLGSFSNMEYYFHQLADGIKSNAVLSLFWLEQGQKKSPPMHVGTSYTQDFWFYSKENGSGTPQSAWAGSLKQLTAGAVRGHPL